MASDVYYVKTAAQDSVQDVTRKLSALIAASGVLKKIGANDFTGIKLHFGEKDNTGHIRHEWVKEVVRHVKTKTGNAFLTDSNVLYKNSLRANSVDHIRLASSHGFDLKNIGSPVIIADGIFGRNFTEVSIGKKHFSKVKIASDIASCDSLIVLSHVTGHMQTGLGGAIKNLGMGCASRRGKYEQHCGVVPEVNAEYCVACGQCAANCPASCITLGKGSLKISAESCIGCGECAVVCRTKAINVKWSETLEKLQEKMVEYAYGVTTAVKNRIGFISFLIKVTRDCDCMAKDDPSIAEDVGMLASFDPVSIDKASVDMINSISGKDVFKKGYPETDWSVQLKYAQDIGLGNLSYKLREISV